MPETIQEILVLKDKHSLCLKIWLEEKIQINCHFFVTIAEVSPLELDIDPKEIQSAELFNLLWTFISNVGNLLNKKINITQENTEADIIASFAP